MKERGSVTEIADHENNFFTGHSPCWDLHANMKVKSARIRLMVNRTWSAPLVGRVRESVDGGVLRELTPSKHHRFVNYDETSDLNPFWVGTMTKCHFGFFYCHSSSQFSKSSII